MSIRVITSINRDAIEDASVIGRDPYQGGWIAMVKSPDLATNQRNFGLFVVAPLVLLSLEKVQNNPQFLYWTCSLVVIGFMANRLNVSITGLQASAGGVLRAQVDRVCGDVDGVNCGRDGVPVRSDLPGYLAEE